MSYLTVSNDGVLNATNNEKAFTELTRVFEEHFEMKVQEVSVLKYLNFRICQYPIGFSIYHNDHIMEIVNEWFPTEKFRNVDTPFLDRLLIQKGIIGYNTINRTNPS